MDGHAGPAFPAEGGAMGALLRAHDWAATPLGPVQDWPQSLRTTVGIVLGSGHAMCLAWGPSLALLYNDAYAPMLSTRHPAALGRPFAEVWADVWPEIEPLVRRAMAGAATWHEDLPLVLHRHGRAEETWWTFSYSPVRDEAGGVAGMLNVCTDTTAKVRTERRQAFRLALDDRLRDLADPHEVMAAAAELLGRHLGGNRCGYGEVEADGSFVAIERDWTDGTMPSAAGRHRLDDFGPALMAELRAGRAICLGDALTDPRLGADAAGAHLALGGLRGSIAVPLVKDGRFTAVFYVHQTSARAWTEAEAALVHDVAERTWAAAGRARAEAAQRAEAEFLRSVLAASGDCIKVLDLEAKLVFMSERGQRVMEVGDFDAVRGCPWPDFWREQGSTEANAAVEAARAGRLGRFQGPADTMAGNPRWWDVQVTPILGPDGRPERLLAVSRDITATRRAEIALREAQGLNVPILNSSRDCIVVLDLDGHTQFVSPGGIESMEVSDVDAILGLSWLRVWKDADNAAARAAVAEARAGGTGRFQGFCPTHKGAPKWWDVVISPLPGADGTPERLVSVGRDITERKQAELALQALNDDLERRVAERTRAARLAEARFRGIVDSTFQLIGLVALDGTMLEANRAALEAGGAALAEVAGLPCWEAPWFRRTPEAAAALRALFPAAASGEFVRTELRLLLPDDRLRVYDFSLSPVRDDQGRMTFVVAEGRDITHLRTMEEQLRQSQKMEAVGQLTGGLAHDFNNLLAGISGSLDMMHTRLAQGRAGELDRYLAAAQGSAKRAAALTHRLLAFTRRQTLAPKAVDVDRLVAGMEELIGRTVGPSVRIEVRGAGGVWTTLVDPNQLENALLNLCINARDAMPDGGRLTIETANRAFDPRAARERELTPGQYVSLCVADTGVGMTAEVARRAFDPFFTTKPLGMGTGLGLSMIYGFVRQSGGQARIVSAPGEGTQVCLYLPRHDGPAGDADDASAAEPAPRAAAGATVLVVDDEPTVRMLVAEVLADLGHGVIEAPDGAAGLQVLQSGRRIDLLITDVGLPGGLNGRQVADAGRALRPGLRVLFITGYAESTVLGGGDLGPGMQVLTKPFALDVLASRIQDAIAG